MVQAFEAVGWPIPEIKRVAAGLLLVSMVLFPVTFRHALMDYANKESQVILHRMQPLLHPPAQTQPRQTVRVPALDKSEMTAPLMKPGHTQQMTSKNGRTVELQCDAPEAYGLAQRAMASIGKVEQASEVTGSLVGKARYGLNPVRLRVSVRTGSVPGTAIIEVGGVGQDVWGAASRKIADRFVAALG